MVYQLLIGTLRSGFRPYKMHHDISRQASFSRCGDYRYSLKRSWDTEKPGILLIGLNPSTADGRQDDPTIRRCIGLSRRWGYGHFTILNLFNFRSPHPRDLKATDDPVGPQANQVLRRHLRHYDDILLFWGIHGQLQSRDIAMLKKLEGRSTMCIGRTKCGSPKHLLYARNDVVPTAFKV